MKLTRRAVLRLTGTAAAALALSGCSASGSAILGSNFSAWLQQTFGVSSSGAASSAASSEAMAASPLPTGEQPAASLAALPAYDADPLTGEAKRSNGRIVGVMVNNISNTTRQNARPQRGLSSADLLIECKVEGGITRFCAVFHDADSIPEIGPLRSGRDQFLQLLMPYQALYYHDGESAACTKFISVYNYSGLNIGGKSYFNTPTHPHMYSRISGKFENTVDELNAKQLSFDNLLVCFAPIERYPGDSGDVQQVSYISGGDAYFFSRGGVQHGRWEKASPEHPLRVYDKTGAEMLFNRGKTYLAIVDDDEWSNFSYQ